LTITQYHDRDERAFVRSQGLGSVPRVPYRPDIDGLRAIAVGTVLLYHLGAAGFGGGYVGVDIFFVISGFLITNIIVSEHDYAGKVDYARFYLHRARRLLPALFTTLAFTLLAAMVLFPPSLLKSTGESAIFAVLSVSNIYFWTQADYFDIQAIAKPLLHTWSLGVEEQFYLVWPFALAALLGLRSRRLLFVVMFLVGVCSLFLNLLLVDGRLTVLHAIWPRTTAWFEDEKAAIFFLPIFRLFEFAIGAALVWIKDRRPPRRWLDDLLALFGLLMIVVGVAVFDEKTVFPSYNALLPCVGAALMIYAGPETLLGRVLQNGAAVGVGKISYSLYLVHWPLIVFYSQVVFRPLARTDMIILAAASLVLAVLLHRFVEQRFRVRPGQPKRLSNGIFLTGIATKAGAIIAISLAVIVGNGWEWRIPESRRALAPAVLRDIETSYCSGQLHPVDLVTCAVDRGAKSDVFVWGDSHARHLVAGLAAGMPDRNIKVLYLSSCLPQSGLFGFHYDYEGRTALAAKCVERNERAFAYLLDSPPATIFIQSYVDIGRAHDRAFIDATNSIVTALSSKGHKVKILSDVIRPGKVLADCHAVPLLYSDERLTSRCVGEQVGAKALVAENQLLETALPPGVFVNLDDFFCRSGKCVAFQNGKPLFRDDHHLTVFGSEQLIRYAQEKDRTLDQ